MIYKACLLFILAFTSSALFAQHPLSQFDKASHLNMLKDGVILVRLSEQDSKVDALKKRGQTTAAQEVMKENQELNDLIVLAFNKQFDFCPVYFIRPNDSKAIIKNKSAPIVDVVTKEEIDLSNFENIYVTDYGFGHPAEGHERYNRKGFQILFIEDGQLTDLGRDIFYVGIKTGFFAPSFSKSMQKSIIRLNNRFKTGKKYPSR